MPLHFEPNNVVFGRSLPIAEFPALLAEHLRRFPNSVQLEQEAYALRSARFPINNIPRFVTAVCEWGGYPGIAGRVHRHNTPEQLKAALLGAIAYLDREVPDCGAALNVLNQLHSLGTPSFSSKHLRFLRPDICPVFDAILRDMLPYSFDAAGYNEFAVDCIELATHLRRIGLPNPRGRSDGAWFAADIEGALFAYANEWL